MKAYPAYKDSGLPWVGEIPAHWDVFRGKRLFIQMNRPIRDDDGVITAFRDGMVTLRSNRRTEGFTNSILEIGYQGIRKGDLVIHQMDGAAGAIGVSDSDGKSTPVYVVCTPRDDANTHYYAFLLRQMARSGYIYSLAKGIRERSTEFRWSEFSVQTYPVPPRAEQDAIVAFLDAKLAEIDRYITQKERLIELLQEQKTALINQAVTRGLNPQVGNKDSGIEWLGQIPEHWDVVRNRRLFREKSNRELDGTEIPLSLSQKDGIVATDDLKERTLLTASRENFKVCLPGDLIANRFKAHLGVFFEANLRGLVTFHYGVFCPITEAKTKFFEHLFHSEPYKMIFAGASNGMVIGLQNLSNQNFYNVKAIVPPLKEQIDIIKHIDEITSEFAHAIETTDKQIDSIKEYRTALIAEAVTGKIDVRS